MALFLSVAAAAQKTVSFPTEDGGVVYADVYGAGDRGVVLAHGGQFNKESWDKQARALVAVGFRVLALDFRGYGKSRGPAQSDPLGTPPLYFDVLASVRYLRNTGAKSVSIVGGSMEGAAAGDASIASRPGEIERVVFLGSAPDGPADKLKSSSLFIVARDDADGAVPRLPESAPNAKSSPTKTADHPRWLRTLAVPLPTDQGDRVMHEIIRFLSAK